MVLRRSTVLLVILCALPANAAAAGLMFTDVQPRSVSWADLGGGAANPNGKAQLELCNSGRNGVGPIGVRPVGFGFTGMDVSGDDSVLSTKPDRLFLGRDTCTTVRISARVAPTTGSSNPGAIVATARGGQIARFRLTVAGPPAVPTPGQPQAANDKQDFLAKRSAPWNNAHLGENSDLIVFVPDDADALPSEGLLGVVMAGNDSASVFANGKAVPAGNHVQRLPIRIDGASRGATYSGKLTITGFEHRADDKAPNVDVSIVVQDVVVWPIFAIIAGLLLSFAAALILRRRLPIKFLRADRERLVAAYREAEGKFRSRWACDFPGYRAPTAEEESRFRDELEDDITQAKKGVWLLNLDSDTWKVARKAVDDALGDAALFGGAEPEALGQTLERLSDALIAAQAPLLGADRVPPFIADGQALLNGGPLPIGGAGVTITEAARIATLATKWKGLQQRMVKARTWMAHFPQEDPATLAVREQVGEIAWLLAQVKVDDDLSAHGLGHRLDDLESCLLRLATTKGWWRPGDPEEIRRGIEAEVSELPLRANDRQVVMEEVSLGDVFAQLVPKRVRVVVEAASHHALEWAVLLIALILGILAALKLLYLGKSFGSAEDYISVVLLGSASAVATPYLTSAAKQLRAAGSRLPFLS